MRLAARKNRECHGTCCEKISVTRSRAWRFQFLGGVMQFENMMTFVRAIKGDAASVLWALIITQRMMTALELQQWTGYKGDNITVSVRLLIDLGWVVARTPRGPWGLAEGRQLPLMPGIEQLQGLENRDSDLIGVAGLPSSSSTSKAFLFIQTRRRRRR